jgi:hypothetical protein
MRMHVLSWKGEEHSCHENLTHHHRTPPCSTVLRVLAGVKLQGGLTQSV